MYKTDEVWLYFINCAHSYIYTCCTAPEQVLTHMHGQTCIFISLSIKNHLYLTRECVSDSTTVHGNQSVYDSAPIILTGLMLHWFLRLSSGKHFNICQNTHHTDCRHTAFNAGAQNKENKLCKYLFLEIARQGPTDEEDGEGDEEQEDMGHQVKSVHEAAIVEHSVCHAVGIDTVIIATKRQGHATGRLLQTSLESICGNTWTPVNLFHRVYRCVWCFSLILIKLNWATWATDSSGLNSGATFSGPVAQVQTTWAHTNTNASQCQTQELFSGAQCSYVHAPWLRVSSC